MQKSLLGEFPAHQGNNANFNTPIVSDNALVYLAYIDPQTRTVLAQWDGSTWRTAVLAPSTTIDPYHNQASVGVDQYGHVHAVYNMHSSPWQYSASASPHDISQMVFQGQDGGNQPGGATPGDSDCTGQCADDWRGPGVAAIPGNQITYPHFAHDENGILYVAYREAFYPGVSDYHERQWSGAICRYNANTQTWVRVARLTDPERVPLGMRMHFDYRNRLHVSGVWGKHYTKAEGSEAFQAYPNYPFYMYADDGQTFQRSDGGYLTDPMDWVQFDQIIDPAWVTPHDKGCFAGDSQVTADLSQRPYLFVFPATESENVKRGMIHFDGSAWSTPPHLLQYSPIRLHTHPDGALLAVSSGPRLHQSRDGGETWQVWDIDSAWGPCIPWVDSRGLARTGVIHLAAFRRDEAPYTVKVWKITL